MWTICLTHLKLKCKRYSERSLISLWLTLWAWVGACATESPAAWSMCRKKWVSTSCILGRSSSISRCLDAFLLWYFPTYTANAKESISTGLACLSSCLSSGRPKNKSSGESSTATSPSLWPWYPFTFCHWPFHKHFWAVPYSWQWSLAGLFLMRDFHAEKLWWLLEAYAACSFYSTPNGSATRPCRQGQPLAKGKIIVWLHNWFNFRPAFFHIFRDEIHFNPSYWWQYSYQC